MKTVRGKVEQLSKNGMIPFHIAKELGVSHQRVYQILNTNYKKIYKTPNYRAFNRHRYHRRNKLTFNNCFYCNL